MTFTVAVRTLEPRPFAVAARRVGLRDLESFIAESVDEISRRHVPAGPAFVMFHGRVDETHEALVEVGVPTETGDRELPGGEAAVTTARGEQCNFPAILGAFEALSAWAQKHGRVLDGAPREVLLGDAEREIVWPLREG
jgi:hypothetical protein